MIQTGITYIGDEGINPWDVLKISRRNEPDKKECSKCKEEEEEEGLVGIWMIILPEQVPGL